MTYDITIIGDTHIDESSQEELKAIFTEVCTYKAQILVILGDYYDLKRPSPKDIYFGTRWAHRFTTEYPEVVMLRGNHAELENDFSNVDYLSILNNIEVVSETKIKDYFFGHFMTDVSLKAYGNYDKDLPIAILKKYKYTFLGHQHGFQKLAENVFHLGSCRFVSFGEYEPTILNKYIATIKDDKLEFHTLKSVIPMVQVYSYEELEKVDYHSKVRIVYKSFDQFKKEINKVTKIKDKFYDLKYKLDFVEQAAIIEEKPKNINLLLENWLLNLEDTEVKALLNDAFYAERIS